MCHSNLLIILQMWLGACLTHPFSGGAYRLNTGTQSRDPLGVPDCHTQRILKGLPKHCSWASGYCVHFHLHWELSSIIESGSRTQLLEQFKLEGWRPSDKEEGECSRVTNIEAICHKDPSRAFMELLTSSQCFQCGPIPLGTLTSLRCCSNTVGHTAGIGMP